MQASQSSETAEEQSKGSQLIKKAPELELQSSKASHLPELRPALEHCGQDVLVVQQRVAHGSIGRLQLLCIAQEVARPGHLLVVCSHAG